MKMQRLGAVSVAALLAGLAQPAFAQDASQTTAAQQSEDGQVVGLGEIVVTAQKRAENLQNVPIAIQAIGGDSLSRSGVANTLQLASAVPSLSLSFSAGGFQPKLRGIGTTANGPGVENPVALYVDNVYYASQFAGLSDLDDVSQVSVLNGPQGTLFGRNATGGVIQITTRDPSREFQFDVKTSLDNYLTSASHVYIGGPLSDTVRLGLSAGYTTQGKGWGENVANGDDVHKIDDSVKLRGKLIFEPDAATTIRITGDYFSRQDSLGPNYRPYPGTIPLIPGFRDTGDPYDVDVFRTSSNDTETWGVSGVLEHDFDFAKFTSTSAYRDLISDRLIVPTPTPRPGLTLPSHTTVSQFSQELQLVSPSSGAFNWTIGGYYFKEDSHVAPLGLLFEGPPIRNPDGSGLGRIDIITDGETESWAAYGQGSLKLGESTNLTLGIRYTSEDRSMFGIENGFLQNGFGIGPLFPPIDAKTSFSKVTYRAALDHRFSDSFMAYASFNTGFKSGGFNLFDPTNPAYGPESLDAYEVGFKSDLADRRVRINGSAYLYDYTNIQVTRFTTTAVIFNGAKARLYGFDLDAEALLTNEFKLRGGVSYLHSEFTDFRNAQFSSQIPTGGVALFAGDATGNRLPYAPEFKFNLAAEYDHETASGSHVRLNANLSHSGSYFGEPDNFLQQKAYTYVNLSAGWTAPHERFGVELFANNIFDKAVATLLPTTAYGYLVDYGNPPAVFGIRLTAKLGN